MNRIVSILSVVALSIIVGCAGTEEDETTSSEETVQVEAQSDVDTQEHILLARQVGVPTVQPTSTTLTIASGDDDDDDTATREHILLARQVGVAH